MLSPEELTDLLSPYFTVSYAIKFFVWSFVPVIGALRNYIWEPRDLIRKIMGSALSRVDTKDAKEAIVKARNWGIIVFAAALLLAGSGLDAVLGWRT